MFLTLRWFFFLLLLCLFPLGGVSGSNSWFPECSVLCILRGDPQCLHIPSVRRIPSISLFVSPLAFFLALSCHQLLSLRFLLFSACVHTSIVSFLLLSLAYYSHLAARSFLMSTLFTLSLNVTSLILLNILISVFSRICSSFHNISKKCNVLGENIFLVEYLLVIGEEKTAWSVSHCI